MIWTWKNPLGVSNWYIFKCYYLVKVLLYVYIKPKWKSVPKIRNLMISLILLFLIFKPAKAVKLMSRNGKVKICGKKLWNYILWSQSLWSIRSRDLLLFVYINKNVFKFCIDKFEVCCRSMWYNQIPWNYSYHYASICSFHHALFIWIIHIISIHFILYFSVNNSFHSVCFITLLFFKSFILFVHSYTLI